MDVKEKLVELLHDAHNKVAGVALEDDKTYSYAVGMEADHLIAHGVTVQEWFPVSEPPQKYRDEYGELFPFLVCEEGTYYPFRALYDGKTWWNGIFALHVKWWMNLPTPPKEKERKDGEGNV